MKEVRLTTIEALEKESSIFSAYGVNMREVVSSIYERLLKDNLFVEQMKQPLNSKHTLYDVYKDKVENLVLDLIDLDKGEQCMLKYSLMRDDYTFYGKWRKELFDILYKELAGK